MRIRSACYVIFGMFCACGNHGGGDSTQKPLDTATVAATDSDKNSQTDRKTDARTDRQTGASGGDTVLWVGKPARYIKRPDFILDGKYDSLQSIFIACGSQQPERIANAGLIAYDDVSNCDTSFRNTIRYILKPLNVNLPPTLTTITVSQEPEQLASHVPLSVTNGTSAVMIKPADEVRIRAAAATHLNDAYRRKILIPMKK